MGYVWIECWTLFDDYVVEMSVHYMLVLEVVKNNTLTLSTESLDLILADLFYLSINVYIWKKMIWISKLYTNQEKKAHIKDT